MTRPHTPYWRQNIRIVVVLLVIWAVAGLGLGVLLVEPLNQIRFAGFKLGFWFAQQGAIYVFVALIAIYAVLLDRLESRMRSRDSEASE